MTTTPDSSLAAPPDAAAPASGEAPIARRSLHDEVVGRLRDMIVEGRLAAGARIHEGRACELLGISRTPLREALKVLASEGLIELMPNRGAVVRSLTPKDMRDMLRVLGQLEALAGELACAAASDADIRGLRQLHDRMMQEFARRNRMEYFHLNQAIHNGIVRIADNATLRSLHDTLQARVKRVRYIGNDLPAQWQDAVDDHQEMIAALEARDGVRLARILRRHLDATWIRVAAVMARAGDKPPETT